MDNVNCPLGFSSDGDYFAHTTLDGQLKLWDTATGVLKAEYQPSAHLSATCTCISWPTRRSIISSPKRKRKRKSSSSVSDSDIEENVNELKLLAMGTASGDVLLYSVVKNDVHCELSGGHTDRVNDICWNTSCDSLFTCSNDKQVIEWSISNHKIKQKFKPDRSNVYSVRCIDSSNILTANNCIKWWNWNDKTLIKRFSGHATEVSQLIPVFLSNSDSSYANYFVSVSSGDRILNAWQLKPEGDSNALASFTLSDEPMFVDISIASDSQPVLISAVTKSGSLHIFEHILNGHRKTPLTPKATLNICSDAPKPSSSKSPKRPSISSKRLPILAARISSDDGTIMFCYGSFIKPIFELMSYENCQKDTILKRDAYFKKVNDTVNVDKGLSKIVSPVIPKSAMVIGPADAKASVKPSLNHHCDGVVTPQNHISNDIKSPNNRDIKEIDDSTQSELSLTLEERLKIVEEKTIFSPSSVILKQRTKESDHTNIETLSQKLINALQSKDRHIIEQILNNDDTDIIKSIIKKIPIELITVFLHELQSCLYNNGEKSSIHLNWLQQLLNMRMTFLSTLPNVSNELGPLQHLLDTRIDTFKKVFALKGRLNLLFSQIQTSSVTHGLHRQRAQINYESSSSEDEESDEEMRDLMEDNDALNHDSDDDDNESAEEDVNDDDDDDDSSDSDEDDDDMKSAYESNE